MKDELAEACLNYYKEDIARMLTEMAEQKGIALKIESVEVAAKDGLESR